MKSGERGGYYIRMLFRNCIFNLLSQNFTDVSELVPEAVGQHNFCQV
jgi:hypothetical protein